MYLALAVFAGILGMLVTGAAVYTAWYVFQLGRSKQEGTEHPRLQPEALLKWTVLDYAMLALVLVGLVFLLADLVGVLQDRDLYPYYHYGYLLNGFIYTLLGLLFMLARLFLVLRLAGPVLAAPHDQNEPEEADEAE